MKFLSKKTVNLFVRAIAFVLCAIMMLSAIGCATEQKPAGDTPAGDTNLPNDGDSTTPEGDDNTPGDENVNPDEDNSVPEEEKSPYPSEQRDFIECDNITINAFFVPMYDEEIRAKMFQYAKDADFDVLSNVYPEDIINEPYDISLHTYEWYKAVMAEAAEYGLAVQTREFVQQNSLEMTELELRKFVKKYKDLPGFGGFYVVDEPFNPSPYANIENIIRDLDPDANVNVNFLPANCYGVELYLRQLCDYGGLLKNGGSLSLDCYCFPNGGGVDEVNLFNNYETLRKAGLITKTNTAVYVQAVGMIGGFNYRRPSEADLRYNIMAALAYGVKEIKYFTFASPGVQDFHYTDAMIDINYEPTELYYSASAINKKVHTIGEYLAKCDATYVYHTLEKTEGVYEIAPRSLFVSAGSADVILSLMEERKGDAEYLMVVSKDILETQSVTLTFDNMEKVYLFDDATGKFVETALNNRRLTLDVLPGDCVLIKLPDGDFIVPETTEKGQNLALGAAVSGTYSAGASGFYLYNLTDGVTGGEEGVRVGSNNGKDQYLTVDLGDVYSLNRVDLYPSGSSNRCGMNNPKDFTILVSADGKKWTEVAVNTEDLSKEYVSVFRFENIDARYVRLRFIGLKGSARVDLAELAAYNDDGTIEDKIRTEYPD